MKKNSMIRIFFLIFFVTQGLYASTPQGGGPVCSVVGIVDREAITHQDVITRLRLILISSGQEVTPELIKQFYPQALQNLIDECIQSQTATKMKISLDPREVGQRIALIEKQNKMPAGALKAFLSANDIPVQTMEKQISATLLWTRYIGQKYGHSIHVSPKEIRRLREKLRIEQSKPSYHVAEIVVYDRGNASEAKKQIEHVHRLIAQGLSFGKLAQQFSQSPSKDGGGDLGFQNLDRFDPELQDQIKRASFPSIIGPVALPSARYPHKWVILALLGYHPRSTNASLPSDEQISAMIHGEALALWSRKELDTLRRKLHHEVRSSCFFKK